MSKIKTWKETHITLKPNEVYTFNCDMADTNIIQLTNDIASGGGEVFFHTEPTVSANKYLMSVNQGHVQTMAFPYRLRTVYLSTDAAAPLVIKVTEIVSEEFMFAFNSAQLVNIQGNVQIQEPITVDGTVTIEGDPNGTPVNTLGDGLKASDLNIDVNKNLSVIDPDIYTSTYVSASGSTTVKNADGKVSGIISDGTATATIQDANGNRWSTKGESHFSKPLECSGHIAVSLDVAGAVYIIYA